MKFDAILVAAGKSERMGGADKLFLPAGGMTVLARTISVFYGMPEIRKICLVLPADGIETAGDLIAGLDSSRFRITGGGKTRTESVERGLALAESEAVLIHDGARPFVTAALVRRVMAAVEQYGSGIPAVPVTDSLRMAEAGKITAVIDRSRAFSVQTPQGFLTAALRGAFEKRNGQTFTDESELYLQYVASPFIVPGEETNIKITTPASYFGLNAGIGIGYDLHTLVPCRKLSLGGVEIAYEKGTFAHSDGDAVLHALMDALLSAVGERDIGHFFPDTDIRFKDIDSAVLLSEVMDIYRIQNRRVQNVSIIIIADKPKLADYILIMKVKIANLLGISADHIGISAKTTEGTAPDTVASYAAVIVI